MLKSIVNGAEHDIISIPMKGKNLFDKDNRVALVGYIDNTGTIISNSLNACVVCKVDPGTSYTVSADMICTNGNRIAEFNEKPVIGSKGTVLLTKSPPNSYLFTITTGQNTKYIAFHRAIGTEAERSEFYNKIMVNEGSTALPYEPYGYQNGWEVRDNQNRLIWGREDELQTTTGTLPFKGYSLPVKVKSLLGNSVQNGTPSPDNIVIPEFCGVRTENLIDESKVTLDAYLSEADGKTGSSTVSNTTDYIDINASSLVISGVRTIDILNSNTRGVCFYDSDKKYIRGNAYSPDVMSIPVIISNIPTNAKYVRFAFDKAFENGIMLNTGSTALPFEPYGYKITFENNGENLLNLDRTYSDLFTTDTTKWMNGAATVNLTGTSYAETEILGDVIKVTSKNNGYGASFLIKASPNTTYTVSFETDKVSSGSWGGISDRDINGTVINTAAIQGKSATFTTHENCAFLNVCFRFPPADGTVTFSNIMVNICSTALPYSPYLNKTTPIYLSEVPTIRRIKKLVLTGDEDWYTYSTGTIHQFYTHDLAIGGMTLSSAFSTIAPYGMTANNRVGDYGCYTVTNGTEIAFQMYGAKDIFPDGSSWKTYLSTQYQNGTPVTVWYILSEPEIGIVNEPLAKIGDYADELTEISVHGLSSPLYGIGNYKDALNLATGVVTGKVKKLVLDGVNDGEWKKSTTRTGSFYLNVGTNAITSLGLCDRAVNVSTVSQYDSIGQMFVESSGSAKLINLWLFDTNISLDDFKSYLSAQYQAGTPVTVWYVLETPTTGTVTVPTGMTGEIEGYLTQISTPTPEHPSIPKWNGEEETGGTYAVTVYTLPEIPTTTGKNTLTVDTTLAPYDVTINGHIKYTYWGKIREYVRSGLAQTKFPVGTILYDNEDESTGTAFQVVGYDKHFDPALTAQGYTHSMTLCQLKLSGLWQFDAAEAFLYTTVEMQPGTYKFKIPYYDTSYGGNKTYYFTSTASVPVDSQITLSWTRLPSTVTAYAGPNPQTKTTPITGFNALQLSEWVEGESPEAIDLGTIKLANNDPDSAYGKLNHIHRVRYGSNNYYQSGLRQLLNTDLASNNWWHPTTIFDRPYANRTTNGYLRSLNEDFINVLATPEITHIANNIFEYPSLDGRTFTLNTEYKINTDKVFLLSHTEVGLSATPNIGTVLDYYSTHNTNNDRIKYSIYDGNAYYWWFRTPRPTIAYVFRTCYASGTLTDGYANDAGGVAPAYIIQ